MNICPYTLKFTTLPAYITVKNRSVTEFNKGNGNTTLDN